MPSTYKDIQKLTGFSLSTISRYFNGENVKAPTRKAIQEAADQLDFHINDYARGLRSKKSKIIGILIPDITSSFITTIIYHMGRLLRLQGYGCLIYDCNSSKKVEIEAMDFLLSKSVDGIITFPMDLNPVQLNNARSKNIPIVLFNRVIPGFMADAVISNYEMAGKMAAEYLLSKGHRKAAVISGLPIFTNMTESKNSFIRNFRGALSFDSNFLIDENSQVMDELIKASYRIIRGLLSKPFDITALFFTNYELTLGAINAINELGLKIPEDISIIGFDNLQLTKIIKPSLTLFDWPIEKAADETVRLILKRLKDNTMVDFETVVLDPRLIEGVSVADLKI